MFLLCTDTTPKSIKLECREILSFVFQLFNMKHTSVWSSNENRQGVGKINFETSFFPPHLMLILPVLEET